MITRVLDASILIAILKREPGWEAFLSLANGGVVSTVNVAELYSKATLRGMPAAFPEMILSGLSSIEPFTSAQARLAGELIAKTSSSGLSLGDRACLALALELNAEVYTTDRAWADISVGCKVNVLR